MSQLTPREIRNALDNHIIGQSDAKRSVAIALRNRWRRMQLDEDLRHEVTPKNILMIGPTGVGKTEIARRLAKLANAPFIKVEATKFTEVGYVGKDVDSIIRDLVEVGIKMEREQATTKVEQRAHDAAIERIIDAMIPTSQPTATDVLSKIGFANEPGPAPKDDGHTKEASHRRQLRKEIRHGELDDTEIEVEVSQLNPNMEIMGPPGMEEMTQQLQDMFQNISGKKTSKRKLKVKDALKFFQDEEAGKLVNNDELKLTALENVEQNGIVFIDEIDKVCRRSDNVSGGDVSREGVQRDLLPLVEGCSVSTKHGMVKTDHILFIASGAFHIAKPSDLVPELQGRLPIRVELRALTIEDFIQILTEPYASLTEQYSALMATEGVELKFTKDGIKRIAEISWSINERVENIGARRLHTVIEKLLEEISFNATEMETKKVSINKKYVDNALSEIVQDEDLSRYIL